MSQFDMGGDPLTLGIDPGKQRGRRLPRRGDPVTAALDRVFPADQLDPELWERPVFARPTDQTIRGAHVHRQTPQRETST